MRHGNRACFQFPRKRVDKRGFKSLLRVGGNNRGQTVQRGIDGLVDWVLEKLFAIASFYTQGGVPAARTQPELPDSGLAALGDHAEHIGEDLIIRFEDVLPDIAVLKSGHEEVNQSLPSPTNCRSQDEKRT